MSTGVGVILTLRDEECPVPSRACGPRRCRPSSWLSKASIELEFATPFFDRARTVAL